MSGKESLVVIGNGMVGHRFVEQLVQAGGLDQYRVIVPVTAGRQTYKVNSWKFRRTIPADDNGERYVFVFDARRLSRPRLVMYPEYLLPKLD